MVVTRGPWGAYALLAGSRDMLHLDQMAVEVGDTVGAWDSFMAGLVSGLLDAGLLGSRDARRRLREVDWSAVQPALHQAVVTQRADRKPIGRICPDNGRSAGGAGVRPVAELNRRSASCLPGDRPVVGFGAEHEAPARNL